MCTSRRETCTVYDKTLLQTSSYSLIVTVPKNCFIFEVKMVSAMRPVWSRRFV
jgi:hypothetical protein